MRLGATALFIAFFTSQFAVATDLALTETKAVELAVKQNLTISAARVQLAAKQLASDRSWGTFVPGLSLSAVLSRANKATSVPSPGTPYYLSGSAQLGASLSLSASSFQNLETARLDYQAGKVSYEEASGVVALQVQKAFYQLLLLEKQLKVTESSIATAEQTLEQIRTAYANGRVQQLTVRQAELSLQTARLTLERQKVGRENALGSFKLLLGVDPATNLRLEGTIEIAPISSEEVAATAHVEERADVRYAALQVELQESKNRAAYLSIVSPTLVLSASLSPSFPDPFNFNNPPGGGWNDRGSLSVSLSSSSLLAFLPFLPQRVNLQILESNLQALKIHQLETAQAARSEIASLTRSIEASTAAISSLRASVNLAQESYDLTKEAYGLGTVDFLTLKSAEDDLLRAQYELLSEEYTYLSAVIGLEHATGLDLRGRGV